MRRIVVGLFGFAVVALTATTAQAQWTPGPGPADSDYNPVIDRSTQTAVPGVTSGGTPAPANEGNFRVYAYISTSLSFDVTDSTIECGAVTPSSAGTFNCTDTAALTVYANAPWLITLNDTAAGLAADVATLDNDDPARSGVFQFALTADASGQDPRSTQNPAASTGVVISAAWTAGTTLNSGTEVDAGDEYGTYQGGFTVILREQ